MDEDLIYLIGVLLAFPGFAVGWALTRPERLTNDKRFESLFPSAIAALFWPLALFGVLVYYLTGLVRRP